VLSNFSNAFQFGLDEFPGASDSCDPGGVVLDIGATPTDIANQYASSGPNGSTPSAGALLQAKSYLLGKHLSVPAYVLLITDGLPNCDYNLNGTTCNCQAPDQSYCDPSVCDFCDSAGNCNYCGTPAYCLDDSAMSAAAASLNSAGIKVFVVGFGAGTSGNNLAVLNAVAAAGGTTHAYSAQDQTELRSQLTTIVGSVGTCCQNNCTSGATDCDASGNQLVCGMQASGCFGWNTTTCGSGTQCQNGQCASCAGTCTPGATQCGFLGDQETCVSDSGGCTSWSSSFCHSGTQCQGGACVSCNNTCQSGQTRCDGTQYQTCQSDFSGCTSWSSDQACGYGRLCNPSVNSCVACNTACTAGTQQCINSSTAHTCVADATGCTTWQQTSCAANETCGGGTCNSCQACTPGQVRCSGSNIQTCVADGQGCSAWQDSQACQAGELCVAGACQSCAGACTLGQVRCNGASVESCVPVPNSCNTWLETNECSLTEVCVNGTCCQNSCAPGATRCGASGQVQTCVAPADACASWVDSACGADTTCFGGACLTTCSPSQEISSCPAGTRCTREGATAYCEPAGGSTGTTATTATTGTTATSQGTGGTSATNGTTGTNGGTATNGTTGTHGTTGGAGGSSGTTSDSAGVTGSTGHATRGTGAGGCGCNSNEGLMGSPLLLLLALRRRRLS
jgi:hypothetical protein